MTRRRRLALVAGAVLCLGLSVVLFTLARDIGRWDDALSRGDARYRTAPQTEGLWHADETLPFGVAQRALGVRDDVRLRKALRAVRLSRLELGVSSDPALVLMRGEARARLQEIAGDAAEPRVRRSRAMGLLGVLSFASALSEAKDQALYIQDAVAAFQGAIGLDPSNTEPKMNLELSLQRGRGIQPTESGGGQNPSPGGAGAKGAGVGDPGSGY